MRFQLPGRGSHPSTTSSLPPFYFQPYGAFECGKTNFDVFDFDYLNGMIENAISGPDVGGCQRVWINENFAEHGHHSAGHLLQSGNCPSDDEQCR